MNKSKTWKIIINSNDCDWMFIDIPENITRKGIVKKICSHPESESVYCQKETCPIKINMVKS